MLRLPLGVRIGVTPPPAAWVGAFLIIAGCAACALFYHWIAAQIFVAVDAPVSLKPGHFRTGPFAINLDQYYNILIRSDREHSYDAGCDSYSVLSTSWTLYKDGQLVDRSGQEPIPGTYLMGFQRGEGTYDLDVEVLKDASCLDSAHPRLRVFASRTPSDDLASMMFWLCALMVGAGSSMLVLAGNRRYRKLPLPVASSALPGMVATPFAWRAKSSTKAPLFSRMPSFGFFAAIVFGLMAMIMLVLQGAGYRVPTGLRVRLLRQGTSVQRSTGIQPLLVRIHLAGRTLPPELYFDSQRLPWKDFDKLLRKEISQRPPNWPVYLEGDPEMDWGWAANAIDRIRGMQAEVVLLTRKSQARMGIRSLQQTQP